MSTSDWIGIANVAAQVVVACVAIWAVLVSLHANKKQIQSSDKQVKEQIEASYKQLREQIEASDLQVRKQIEESRRLATEERHHQLRPILAPKKEIWGNAVTYMSLETGEVSESLYAPDGRIYWNWPHALGLHLENIGNGPAFNIHAILYGPENTSQSQFVSWNNGPLAEKSPGDIFLDHPNQLRLFHNDTLTGRYPLYDKTLNHNACLTITYHDLVGKKHASIFYYTLQRQWIHVATEEIAGEPPLDLKELDDHKKQQEPKLSASPVKTSRS